MSVDVVDVHDGQLEVGLVVVVNVDVGAIVDRSTKNLLPMS